MTDWKPPRSAAQKGGPHTAILVVLIGLSPFWFCAITIVTRRSLNEPPRANRIVAAVFTLVGCRHGWASLPAIPAVRIFCARPVYAGTPNIVAAAAPGGNGQTDACVQRRYQPGVALDVLSPHQLEVVVPLG